MVDKTQPERQRRYRANLKEQVARAKIELPARIAELEAENAELKRRHDETSDTLAEPSLLDRLSPVARAEFDRVRTNLRGATDREKITDLVERLLLSSAKNREKTVAKQQKIPAPEPELGEAELEALREDLAERGERHPGHL